MIEIVEGWRLHEETFQTAKELAGGKTPSRRKTPRALFQPFDL